MSEFGKFNDCVWDRFFDFLLCDEELSREETQERLRNLGVDVTPGLRRVQQALKASQARSSLEAARAARPSLLARIGNVVAPVTEKLRDQLHDLITRKFTGTTQTAYFRKLEEAASEKDLQSLLDDLCRLEKLSEDE